MISKIRSLRPSLGPNARRLLDQLRFKEATRQTFRIAPFVLLAWALWAWLGDPPLGPMALAVSALIVTVWCTGFRLAGHGVALPKELDRLAAANDRCATLAEPLPEGLADVIAHQLETCVDGVEARWNELPWRRVLLGLASLGLSLIAASSGEDSRTALESNGPAASSAGLVARLEKAASAIESSDQSTETRELQGSLRALGRLAASDGITEDQLEDLRQEASERVRETLRDLEPDGEAARKLGDAMRALADDLDAPGAQGDGAASTSSSQKPVLAAATDEDPKAPDATAVSALRRTTWDPRYDTLISRYFEQR